MAFAYLTARFKDTKSTCGAATCTVTSVDGGKDGNWAEDSYSETHRMLLRIAVQRCRVCNGAMIEPKLYASERDNFLRGDPATCDSCYTVSVFSH